MLSNDQRKPGQRLASPLRSAGLGLLLLALAPGAPGQDKPVYKWRDANGEIHYGHAVPPELVEQEHARLSAQGTVVERVEKAGPPLTPEQREARDQERQSQQRERMLLATYRSEQDVMEARDQAVALLREQRRLAEEQLKQLLQRLAEATAVGARLEASNKAVPDDLQQTVTSLQEAIVRQERRLPRLDAAIERVRERYAQELRAYRDALAGDNSTG